MLTSEIIRQDNGLSDFLKKISSVTYLSIMVCISLTYSFVPFMRKFYSLEQIIMIINAFSSWRIFFGFVATLVSMKIFNETDYTVQNNDGKYYVINSKLRKLSYCLIIFGYTVMFLPTISMYYILNPSIMLHSCIYTVGVVLGAIVIANELPLVSLLKLKTLLSYSLFGIIIIHITSRVTDLNFVQYVTPYIGILIFSLCVAYGVHQAILMYYKHTPDHLECSVKFCIEFLGILLWMMEIIYQFQKINQT